MPPPARLAARGVAWRREMVARGGEIAYLDGFVRIGLEFAATMAFSRLPLDPEGYYARLGVAPSAEPEAITAAWRRRARIVHPDVPGTGDAAAFLALKQAYDVLIHADRRAAYDRTARLAAGRNNEPGVIDPPPLGDIRAPPSRQPRLHDLPTPVWVGLVLVLLVGMLEVGLHLAATPGATHQDPITATAPDVPPLAPDAPSPELYGPRPLRLAGTPNFYVVPAASPAMLWRVDQDRHVLVPWRELPAFSAVEAIRLLKSSGLVEIRVTDKVNGYVDASRLMPGDPAAAARGWCTYNAGATPENGEVLSRAVKGHAKLTLENHSGQLAVVKFRSAAGADLVSVFLDPGGNTVVEGLPDEPLRIDVATGEVWSRACHGFAAGMRAQRMARLIKVAATRRLDVPPDPSAAADLSDQAFEQE